MTVEDLPETVVLDGSPSAESDEPQGFNPYGGTSAGAGPYVQPLVPVPQKNDEATWSMVLGIVTWFCNLTAGFLCITGCLAPFTTIAGVVLGHMGLKKANEMSGMGKNEAIAGLVMSYLSLALYVVGLLFGAALLGGVGFGLS